MSSFPGRRKPLSPFVRPWLTPTSYCQAWPRYQSCHLCGPRKDLTVCMLCLLPGKLSVHTIWCSLMWEQTAIGRTVLTLLKL
jgi:hypothetical protein